jgi:hypothetical protein
MTAAESIQNLLVAAATGPAVPAALQVVQACAMLLLLLTYRCQATSTAAKAPSPGGGGRCDTGLSSRLAAAII